MDMCPTTDHGCGARGVRFRKLEIQVFPEVLTIYINRRLVRGGKDHRRLEYPLRLTLPSCSAEYWLRSVVVHDGQRAASGHYFSFVNFGGDWFKFNDDTIEKATVRQVMYSQATLLVYEASEQQV